MMQARLDGIAEFPKVHLVVGVVGPVEHHRDGTLGLFLEQLIEAQGAKGAFGVGELLDGDHLSLHCAFRLKADADRFADAFHATSVDRTPGLASQRQFQLKSAMVRALSNGQDCRR